MKKYFYNLISKYIGLYVLPENTAIDVNANNLMLSKQNPHWQVANLDDLLLANPKIGPRQKITKDFAPDFFVLNGNIHYELDIIDMFNKLHALSKPSTRLILTYYSSLWKPFMRMASKLGIRSKTPELNWISNEDVDNFLNLASFQLVHSQQKILLPFYIPLISALVNRYVAPLPFFRLFAMVNVVVARPIIVNTLTEHFPSVSIVVAARNEAGNIEKIIERLPILSSDDELIFVEGGSTDSTWEKLKEAQHKYKDDKTILIAQQDGKGKGDAVRKGFSIATKDILMILDADMTVPPEDLPKFYDAIRTGKGEFINGSRLVYPMEQHAMRFWNLLGNKFFAGAFSFVLGQRFKDTLCGTKVLSRVNYEKLARNRRYFGDFDPFGDFDLIFGAARMGLKIVELPVRYKERTYGDTNISRWRHGMILIAMLSFAARKIKFI